jgi:quercetin dioxygenase-like cupin family protein
MNNSDEGRLRESPRERFGAAENMFDMADALRKLRAENAPARLGHREITLDQNGPVTLMLFSFEAGGILKDHKANGVVTIQALEGEVIVRTETEEYRLSPHQMVMFAPNVTHSVEADRLSALLLTVCLLNNMTDHQGIT